MRGVKKMVQQFLIRISITLYFRYLSIKYHFLLRTAMSDKVRQLWTPYHSSGDEQSSDSSASSTTETITPLATLCNAIDVMEKGHLSEEDTNSIVADERSQQWTHYERSSSDDESDERSITSSLERNSPNAVNFDVTDASDRFTWDCYLSDEVQSYYKSVCSSSLERNRPNAVRCYASNDVSERDDMGSASSVEHSYDSSSTSSSDRFSVNATLYNTIAALEDEDIDNAPTIVADFFREYKDDQEFIQANLDYRDSRNTSNNVVHLLITKRSDFVIPALQQILQYDRNLIEETNDDLQTPFSIAISYNVTVYMLSWLYEKCPSNAEVMNSVGAFPEELLTALYPYSFQRIELPKDLLYRIHIAASIGCPTGFLRLLLEAKPDDIPIIANGEGKLPIHYACQNVDETNFENVLILSNCCAGGMQIMDNTGCTPLHYLKSAAEVVDEDGKNLLHRWAQYNGTCSMEAFQLLHDTNPDAFFQEDKYGFLPIHYLSINRKSSHSVIFEVIKMYPTVLVSPLAITAQSIIDSFFDSNSLVESYADDETASVTDVIDLYNYEAIYSPMVSSEQPFVKDTSAEVTRIEKVYDEYNTSLYDDLFSNIPDDWLDSSKTPTVEQSNTNAEKPPLPKKLPMENQYAKNTKRSIVTPASGSAGTDSWSNNGAALEALPSIPDHTLANDTSAEVTRIDAVDDDYNDSDYDIVFSNIPDAWLESSKAPTVEQLNAPTEKPPIAKKLPMENPYKNKRSVITPSSGGSALIPFFHQNKKPFKEQQKSDPKVLDTAFQQTTFVPTPIRDVQDSNANKVKVTGIVTWKCVGVYNQLSRRPKEGRFFLVHLMDANQDSICIKAFEEECDKYVDKVIHGGIYTLYGMIAETSTKRTIDVKYPPTNRTILKVTSDTVITKLKDDGSFPRPPILPTKLIDMSEMKQGDRVDIVTVICKIGPVYVPVQGKSMMRELQISDGTGFVKLTLFRDEARTADRVYNIGDIIAVSQLKVMPYRGDICLSHCGDPIIVNPTNIPEATAVAEWWKNHDKKIIGHNVRVSVKK